MVDRAAIVFCFNFGYFFPLCRALVISGVMRSAIYGAFPCRGSLVPLWAIPEAVISCTSSTGYYYLALGFYMAVFLTIIALFQSIRFVILFAIKDLFLPNKAFINNAVCVLRNNEFDNNECCRFLIIGFRKLFYKFNFRVKYK
jgi:hypothetical protein